MTSVTGFTEYPVPGCGRAIAANDAHPWILGCAHTADGVNYGIYHFVGTGFGPTGWQQVAGAATQIAVSPEGTPWVVNAAGVIYKWNGSSFAQVQAPGCATSIGVGLYDSAWITGCDAPVAGNRNIYRLSGGSWTQVAGKAASIAVSNQGTAWVVNAAGQTYRFNGTSFESIYPAGSGACVKAIAVGPGNEAWMVNCTNVGAGGNGVGHWEEGTRTWTGVPGAATAITVATDGRPYVVNAQGKIFYPNTPGGTPGH